MASRATPAQDKLFGYIVSATREKLTVEQIRELGVPRQVISDFELEGALHRDREAYTPPVDDGMDHYDRRGLLNVLGYLTLGAQVRVGALEKALRDMLDVMRGLLNVLGYLTLGAQVRVGALEKALRDMLDVMPRWKPYTGTQAGKRRQDARRADVVRAAEELLG